MLKDPLDKTKNVILFRAWSFNEKRMLYNVLYTHDNGAMIDTYDKGLLPIRGEYVVMQFTGYEDANGIYIYDADIVRFDYRGKRHLGIINWVEYGFFVIPYNSNKTIPLNKIKNICVIGNLYENDIEKIQSGAN